MPLLCALSYLSPAAETAVHETVEEGECPYKSFYVKILMKE